MNDTEFISIPRSTALPGLLTELTCDPKEGVNVTGNGTIQSDTTTTFSSSSTEELQEFLNAASLDVDETSFPSFEEWRRQNLEKAGQSSEDDLGERQQRKIENDSAQIGDQQPDYEDSKIEEDMEGWLTPENVNKDHPGADGKVYKDRFNYASFDCAATIMKTNADTKGAPNILIENKDTYLLNKCSSQNKFVIIELCQDILVDTVAIANFEFFSSMFRHIRISVSDRFPVANDGWHNLGEFEAASVRNLQYFYIKNPLIWARYLQVEFLSHWGNEFYCPISLVRVHGTTMMDEYKNQEEKERRQQQQQEEKEKVKERDAFMTIRSTSSAASSTEESVQETREPTASITSESTPDKLTKSSLEHQELLNNETSPKNVSLPKSNVSVSNISPLVLNESCSWDEYLKAHDLNPVIHNDTAIVSDTNKNSTGTQHTLVQQTSAEPKTQDSIYQTIMKRLSLLESNATLSLKYIEEQSQNLRDLLMKIEKKQNMRIELFFNEFNKSVVEQLELFQTQYSNLLMQTVYDLESQRRRSDRDVSALSSRLSLLADELVYQKKVGLAQAIVLLVILAFVIITRGTQVDSYAVTAINQSSHRFIPSWGPALSSWPGSPLSTPRSPPNRGYVFVSNSGDEQAQSEEDDRPRFSKGHQSSLSTNDLSIYQDRYYNSYDYDDDEDDDNDNDDNEDFIDNDEFYDSDSYLRHEPLERSNEGIKSASPYPTPKPDDC
ncbi:hypothetical protein TRICI_000339 [Trichomonascus ciferrii]|uniref:SUN-like protein 1 n=1 Tax=Trichomonascus ciferrii TaxID=44093 RepID=A0A642VDL1_9ASCO|nr:hypothetical protein TRICI_000339 [Trichomonascus ciferrii]